MAEDLVPLMLSELVQHATKALKIHGDMIVWLETTEPGYEFNDTHSQPVVFTPRVISGNIAKKYNYWQDKEYEKAFFIEGV